MQLPEGAQVGIVVFEDLQCPDCARAHPELLRVAASEKVPVVIHDFPITRHAWAFPAAILARWFGAHSPALEVEFRSAVFHHQSDITPENLREFGEQFAAQHELQLPPDVDPDGRLAAAVQRDFDLAARLASSTCRWCSWSAAAATHRNGSRSPNWRSSPPQSPTCARRRSVASPASGADSGQ